MEEDCDEDVIFENSPLYQHLKEAGVSDFDAEPIRASGKDSGDRDHKTQGKHGIISNISCVCHRCFGLISSLFQRRKGHDRILQFYQHQVLTTLCSSSVLVEEDQGFLQDFVGKDVNTGGGRESLLKKSWIKLLLPSVLLPCLLASVIARLTDSDTPQSLTFDLGLCVSSVMGVAFMALVARDYQRRRHYDWLCSRLTDFLDTAHSLLTLTRKSLRLIQETELVARGFTLVSQKTAVSQLEQKPSASTMRQCPELRRCLFTTARSTTLMWREATHSLIKLQPLIPEIDSISHYLCGISLEEYGPCLHSQGEGETGDRELYHLTDGYSVAALKAMTELFSLHLSEFVRRLALCFSQPSQLGDQEMTDPFKTFIITNQLQETLKRQELSIHRLYDFHKCSPQGRQPKHHTPHSKHTSQTEEFYIAVHSLDLHLQSAISRVRDLANQLETRLEGGETTEQNAALSDSTNKNWESFMSGVKAELEACKGCWEEGMSRLEKSKKQVPKLDGVPDMISQKPQSIVIPFAEIGDPIIEDQVFEAYTDPDEVDPGCWTWEPILSPEEKEKKKREKQEALRLLTELKSVISVRAQDRERREQVALNRMRQGKTTPSQSDNNLYAENVHKASSNACAEKTEVSQCDNDHILSLSDELGQLNKHSKVVTLGKQCRDELQSNLDDSPDCEPGIEIMQEKPSLLKGDDDDDEEEEEDSYDNCAVTVPDVTQDNRLDKDEMKHGSYNLDPSSTLHDAYINNETPSDISVQNIKHESSNSDEDPGNNITSEDGDKISMTARPEVSVNEANTVMTSAPEGHDLADRNELKERLERIHGANLGFTANVAAMAAARSASLKLTEQTFGDTFGDSSSEEGEEEDIVG